MAEQLKEALAERENDSPAGKLIIAGFARAALESKVLPDVGKYRRSTEGIANIIEAALASIKHAPEAAADLAEALVAQRPLGDASRPANLLKHREGPDGHVQDRFVGLYPALKTLPPQSRRSAWPTSSSTTSVRN